jgi:ketosteroid isomerase-like protein
MHALLFAFVLAQQPVSEQRLAWRDELLAADAAAADTARLVGLAGMLNRLAIPEIVLLYPGAPIIAGREAVARVLAAQPALPRSMSWVPLYAEVSEDGRMGVSYGVTGNESMRFGKYLSAWRRGPDGWRIVAHAQLGIAAPTAYIAPTSFTPPALPRVPAAAADFVRADAEFAAHAARAGAPDAFAKFVAVDGVMFPATGELVRGRAEVRRLLAEGPQASWVWRPLAAGASSDIGWTVGEAVITAPGGGTAFYTKYLSLWRRERDGSIRFIADGGNARPGN